jgi:hypothetical protein
VPTQMPYRNFSLVPMPLILQSRLAQQNIGHINTSPCWTKLFIHPRHISTVKQSLSKSKIFIDLNNCSTRCDCVQFITYL